jgi:acyl-CoA thioesterase I
MTILPPALRKCLFLLPLMFGWSSPALAQIEAACKAPLDITRLTEPLKASVESLKQGRLKIVAIGSSTTAGAGASKPSATYPARLELELTERLPGVKVEVVNKGVGGQLAAQMVDRLKRDVFDERPSLVIWQTGVNDAVRSVDVAEFRRILKQGITALKAHGLDVILMDLQYYGKSEKILKYPEYIDAMRDVADEADVPLFRRYAVMKYWLKTGQFSPETMLAADSFHMIDRSYRCLAALVADAIRDRIRESAPDIGSRAVAQSKIEPR